MKGVGVLKPPLPVEFTLIYRRKNVGNNKKIKKKRGRFEGRRR